MNLLSCLPLLLSTALVLAAATPATLESNLRAAKKAPAVPTTFEAVYDDMHPLWGGQVLRVRGDGTAHMETRSRGQAQATVKEAKATPEELKGLVDLMVAQEAWLQMTPDRPPVPDESRATLKLSLEGTSGGFWEWYNDMEANARLARIRDRMTEIAAQ